MKEQGTNECSKLTVLM